MVFSSTALNTLASIQQMAKVELKLCQSVEEPLLVRSFIQHRAWFVFSLGMSGLALGGQVLLVMLIEAKFP